jgi:chromosome segregation ATPase
MSSKMQDEAAIQVSIIMK